MLFTREKKKKLARKSIPNNYPLNSGGKSGNPRGKGLMWKKNGRNMSTNARAKSTHGATKQGDGASGRREFLGKMKEMEEIEGLQKGRIKIHQTKLTGRRKKGK